MANVNIKFNGKEFLLSCDDGQEEHLEELSEHLNKKFVGLKASLGNIGENKLLLITSIKVMDEYFETKKKVEQKTRELKDLSNKLYEWTNTRWIITLSKKKGGLSIKENKLHTKKKILVKSKESINYKKILENFPDAEMIDVKINGENENNDRFFKDFGTS